METKWKNVQTAALKKLSLLTLALPSVQSDDLLSSSVCFIHGEDGLKDHALFYWRDWIYLFSQSWRLRSGLRPCLLSAWGRVWMTLVSESQISWPLEFSVSTQVYRHLCYCLPMSLVPVVGSPSKIKPRVSYTFSENMVVVNVRSLSQISLKYNK